MLDAFAKLVAQADARGEFLSNTQLESLSTAGGGVSENAGGDARDGIAE